MSAVETPTQPPQSPAVPAGWYPDPQGQVQRYWAGSAWTDHTAPVSNSGPPVAASPAVTAPAKRETSLGVAVLLSILMPLIGFIVGIVWLSKGRSSDGIVCMVVSAFAFFVWVALLGAGA
jgi:hypothetical protein